MSKLSTPYRFLFAGGGTGGHLYPAIAVADEIKRMQPDAQILFVGTKSKIEERVVPKLGFQFKSIWIKGFARKLTLSNVLFPVRLIVAMVQSLAIAMKFKPKVAIGSGGYIAGPAIWGASVMGAKIILIEPNSYPGITTRLLEKHADEIHVAFEDSKKYLRQKDKVILSGNPIRTSLKLFRKSDALNHFGLDDSRKTILILGGSLGAGSINKTIAENLSELKKLDIQIIWQTGSAYYEEYKNLNDDRVKVYSFIDEMDKAYSSCDLVVARAGASTISELAALGLPSLLIPSPNVAENHQYHNAKSLSDVGAAVLMEDKNLKENFLNAVSSLVFAEEKLKDLGIKIKYFSKPDAANIIAKRAINFAIAV
ncbi:MAG: undecaprenyldiphospho-muramoylpentapeptide beta-N-acetylglucosaminyltransferase [Ignavibacteriaceae bacterium]|nr:undecaprenyldiphospho-muramoylpentapeptide beta-N-acetylglucosaminyltransferase [Ignavibacteriaceae bacterium]